MQLTDKQFAEFKALCAKHNIVYKTDMEYRQSAMSLIRLVKVLHDGAYEEFLRQEQLKKEPQGFAVPSKGRTCSLCRQSVYGEVWYDKWGMRCMNCQAAYKRRIIPGYVFKDSDNHRYITGEELHSKLGVHPQTVLKLVRDGKLKPRTVPHGPMVFLKRDNPNLPDVIEEVLLKRK